MNKQTPLMRYAAFISYAHTDEVVAARLHKRLETYPLPKSMRADGRSRLSPIFRDAAELTAHHSLPEKIREAVEKSRYLIVLCSPAAKASHWVNEEIRLFRTRHGDAAILAVLISGTPDTSFPSALIEGGREPLAANIEGGKHSFHLGTTQLAASLLGVGLDELLQRDATRRRRRTGALMLGAVGFSALMGSMAYTAIEARNEAQANRAQAEGLVEYMITELKSELEPVGRLDVLDGVGDKVVEYYETQDINALPDASLARQARARQLLGEVALSRGNVDDAEIEIAAATKLTQEVLTRNPNDPDAIFAHAQSAFWDGKIPYQKGDFDAARSYWTEYAVLSQRLYELKPADIEAVMEAGYGENNLGNLELRTRQYDISLPHFKAAIERFEDALKLSPDYYPAKMALANALAGASQAALTLPETQQARQWREGQIKIYQSLLQDNPANYSVRGRLIKAQLRLINDIDFALSAEARLGMMRQPLAEMEDLIEFEPENAEWRVFRNRYRLRYLNLLGQTQALPLRAKNMEKYAKSIERIWPDARDNPHLHEAKIREALYRGQKNTAAKGFMNHKETRLKAHQNKRLPLHTLNDLRLLSIDMGQTDSARQVSGLMVTYDTNYINWDYPSNMHLKMLAHMTLGQCEEAKALHATLASLGYIAEPQLTICE